MSCNNSSDKQFQAYTLAYSTKYNRDVSSIEDFEMKGVAMQVVSLRGVKSNRKHCLFHLVILGTNLWS